MQRNILVIDDDPAILATVADILGDEGYLVRTAANGAEGLAAVEQSLPALVLLDMRMPVLDGWSFVRTLRERGVNLPIVVMTAAQDVRRWAQEVGAVDYLAKPFDLPELLAVVERPERAGG
jgi:CheY-like chemotaxis protein